MAVDALIGAVTALAGAGLGAFAADRLQRQRVKRLALTAEREHVAVALGAASALLRDCSWDRERLWGPKPEGAHRRADDLRRRLVEVRQMLLTVRATHHGPEVQQLAELLSGAVEDVALTAMGVPHTRDAAKYRTQSRELELEAAYEVWDRLRRSADLEGAPINFGRHRNVMAVRESVAQAFHAQVTRAIEDALSPPP